MRTEPRADKWLTILEANFRAGQVTQRQATGTSLADAQSQLRIVGYYRP